MLLSRTALPLLLLALLLSLAAVAVAAIGDGDLRFRECLSGKRAVTVEPRSPREGGCRPSRTVEGDAHGSAMRELTGLVASPDGRSLYAVTADEDAVTAFRPKPLALTECFTAIAKLRRSGPEPCRLLPRAAREDANTGFNGVFSAAISPDGRSLYTVSRDNSIGIFARARSGKLAYRGCLTGDISREGTGRIGVCKAIPTATNDFDATNSGLSNPISLVVSPNGRFVYAAVAGEMGIAILSRAASGSLTFLSCLRGGTPGASVAAGAPICPLVAPEGENPSRSGLRGVRSLAISPDGRSLYASSPGLGALAEFSVDPTTGALGFRGCISSTTRGSGPGDPCRRIPSAGELSAETGMSGLRELVVSPDGRSAYGVARHDDTLVHFSRDSATGALAFVGCLTGDSGLGEVFGDGQPCAEVPGATPKILGSGLATPTDVVVSPSGRRVYVAAKRDSAVAVLERQSSTGTLSWMGCLTVQRTVAAKAPGCRLARAGRKAQRLGFSGFTSLAIAGRNLFATASGEGAISRFSIAR